MRHGRFGFLGICTTSLLTVFITYKKGTASAVPSENPPQHLLFSQPIL